MKKKLLSILLTIVIVISLCFSTAIVASAASGTTSIGFSAKTVNINTNVTVKVTFNAPKGTIIYGGVQALLEYDKEKLDFVSGDSVRDLGTGILEIIPASSATNSVSVSLVFKTKKVGTATFKVYNGKNEDFDVPAKNESIHIEAPTKSSDNTLKSLKVGAGTLTPAFSRYVTEYKVTVPYNVDYFDINGVKNHSGASISYSTGDKGPDIKVGTTVRTITVTAENGSVRKYNITVTRLPQDATSSTSSADTSSTTSTVEPEENKLETVVDGNKMTVAEIIPDEVTAAGFEKGEYTFNSVHVPAFLDKDKEVVLLYLLDEEGKGGLYMYNSATGIFSLPCFINDARNYTILPVSAIKRDQLLIDTENVFNLSTVTIGQQQVEAYIYKDDALSDFAIVCAMNEKGEKGFYRYDIAEGTLQRYVAENREESPAGAVVSGLANTDTIVVIVCAAVCLAAIIAIIIIWAARRRYYDEEDFDDFDDAEPLFIKETELDTAETDENFIENENQGETEENDGETESEEE